MKNQRTSVLRVIKSNELDTDKALISDLKQFIESMLEEAEKSGTLRLTDAMTSVNLLNRAKEVINGRK